MGNLAAVVGIAFIAAGCASAGPSQPKPAAGPEAKTSEPEPFQAPNDPTMGQVVITVPEVLVSAPAGIRCGNLGQTVRSQLAATLAQSPNLLVADRQALKDIGLEEELARKGATDPRDKPALGKLAGARYLIKAEVTEFSEEADGKSKGGRVELGWLLGTAGSFAPGVASTALRAASAANPTFGTATETVHGLIGMELQIVDVDTDTVVRSMRAHGSLTKEHSRKVLGIAGISATDSSFNQSVLGQATHVAVEDAVRQVHGALRAVVASERLQATSTAAH